MFKSERTPKCWGQPVNSGDRIGKAEQVSDIAEGFERAFCHLRVTEPSVTCHTVHRQAVEAVDSVRRPTRVARRPDTLGPHPEEHARQRVRLEARGRPSRRALRALLRTRFAIGCGPCRTVIVAC